MEDGPSLPHLFLLDICREREAQKCFNPNPAICSHWQLGAAMQVRVSSPASRVFQNGAGFLFGLTQDSLVTLPVSRAGCGAEGPPPESLAPARAAVCSWPHMSRPRMYHPPRSPRAAWVANEEQWGWPRQGDSKVTVNPLPIDYQPVAQAAPAMCSLVTESGNPPSIQPSSRRQEDTDKCCWKNRRIGTCEGAHPSLPAAGILQSAQEGRQGGYRQPPVARTPGRARGPLLAGSAPRLCPFLALHLRLSCAQVLTEPLLGEGAR